MLFSLRELRGIEARRVEDEAATMRAHAAEQARRAAELEAQRRADAEQRRLAEEAIERHTRETLALRLREEELRVREAEARARADHEARLASEQLTRELDAQRAAAIAKRPVWLSVAAGATVLVLGVATYIAVTSHRARAETEKAVVALNDDVAAAQQARDKAIADAAKAKGDLGQISAALGELGGQLDTLERQIKAANTAAERQTLGERAAAVRARKKQLEDEAKARREGFHGRCPVDKPLC